MAVLSLRQVPVVLLLGSVLCAAEPPRSDVVSTLDRACRFYHDHCARHGGYVWRYSRDLTLTEGEAETDKHTIWVQPPGTPSIGLAFVAAYDATGNHEYLDWAREAALALVAGQMKTGGWDYSIRFAPQERVRYGYRDNPQVSPRPKRKNATCRTILDDDTTPAALRLLMEVDLRLGFSDQQIHEAVEFGLKSIATMQYPNGGWAHNWDQPVAPRSAREFPVRKASFPPEWSRTWLNDWPGKYYTNDNIAGNQITAYLRAWEIYDNPAWLEVARRTGEFLLRAQLPDPQPAWAQQYDVEMHPCWDRKFEPPAISSHESEEVVAALLLLYEKTGEQRWLEAAGRALPYLQKSRRPDGRINRFYELQTNRPLFFDREYNLTDDERDMPTHYGFVMDSDLDDIQRRYDRLAADGPGALAGDEPAPADSEISRLMTALDSRGGWLDARSMRGYSKASPEGVYQSETFIANVATLCQWLRAHPP